MNQRHHLPVSDRIVSNLHCTFTVNFAIEPDGSYVVTCPELPGVEATGMTSQTARDWARRKIIGHLEKRDSVGDPVPLSRFASGGDWNNLYQR